MRQFTNALSPHYCADRASLIKNGTLKAGQVLNAEEKLRRDPISGGNIQKVRGQSEVRRLRFADKYRLMFKVDGKVVHLLAIELKGKGTYKGPSKVDTAKIDTTSGVLPQQGSAPKVEPEDYMPPQESGGAQLVADLLAMHGVTPEQINAVRGSTSTDELYDKLAEAGVPEDTMTTIFHLVEGSPPEVLEDQPKLEYPTGLQRDRWDRGDLPLSELLLFLDDEQRKAASRSTKGPLMVRGGAGTGKSIVALYRIRDLFAEGEQIRMFEERPPKVLFLTYTNALVGASGQLLDKLLSSQARTHVTCRTVDKQARDLTGMQCADRSVGLHWAGKARQEWSRPQPRYSKADRAVRASIAGFEDAYLLDEFTAVIDGRDLREVQAYLDAPRRGRGTRLTKTQRRAVWDLHGVWRSRLERLHKHSFERVQAAALEKARRLNDDERYDFVFVDEAQDLKPVGIRLALALCRSPHGLFLTADSKQSIYGRGYSWRQVDADLDLRGKSVVLKRNYRSTVELERAAGQFLEASGMADPEEASNAFRRGEQPACREVPPEDEGAFLAEYISDACRQLRVRRGSAAVLVSSIKYGRNLAKNIRAAGLRAMFVGSKEVSLESDAVQVMTVHTAKGLEFPVVVLAGVSSEAFPSAVRYQPQDDADREEYELQEQRLFYVAITRAMRTLLVTYPADAPSDFLIGLDTDIWDWN